MHNTISLAISINYLDVDLDFDIQQTESFLILQTDPNNDEANTEGNDPDNEASTNNSNDSNESANVTLSRKAWCC